MSEIRKQKNKYQEELTWAPPLCGPASWLAHPAAGPAHLPPCLPALPLLASMPWTMPRLPPALSHSPAVLPSSPSLSLSHGRTPPSPPFARTARCLTS